MVQIAVRLSKNEQKLMSRVPQEEGEVRDLELKPTPESRWYWAGDPITMKATQFISNAIEKAAKGQITVKSYGWSRLRPIDRNNPLNANRERRTFMVNETTRKALEEIQVRENFETLTDTLIWCMYNYSDYLRIHGVPQAAQPKRRYAAKDYRMVTIRVSQDNFDEFTKVAEENNLNIGRVIHDYVEYAIREFGLHGVCGKMYPPQVYHQYTADTRKDSVVIDESAEYESDGSDAPVEDEEFFNDFN